MLGLTFRVVEPRTPPELWRTVVLPIPGRHPLTVAVSSDRRGCAALASAMLGTDEDGLDIEMIDDFLCELANMTAGQIKIDLSLDQTLGLPQVFDGDELFTADDWAHHVLDCESTDASICIVVSLLPAIL
jgi:CheY-specific phosphatase CheX